MDIREIHWLMDMITHTNVGLVVFNREGQVAVWNHFMENHSGISSTEIKDGGDLYSRIPALRAPWFQSKVDAVLTLQNEVFIGWEQTPHLLPLTAHRPISSGVEQMYQNVTLNVLKQANGESDLIVMMVYDTTEVALGKLALQKSNEKLQLLSRTDALTGLFNRGYWSERLTNQLDRFHRYKNHCALVLFDIDHFKAVNDTYGHIAGDQVIKMVASLASEGIRGVDSLGRYGGEEFGLILPETSANGAFTVAERIRQAVEGETVVFEGRSIRVTISLGIAELHERIKTDEEWLGNADDALYRSKESGRNQTQIYA